MRGSLFLMAVLNLLAGCAAVDQADGPSARRATSRDSAPLTTETEEPAATRISIVFLRNAPADETAEILRQLSPGLNGLQRVVPDERANQLYLLWSADERNGDVYELIESLDQPGSGDRGCTYSSQVHVLEHAEANDVVEHLRTFLPPEPPARLAANERTNTVWVAGHGAYRQQVADIIEHLDKPGRTFVAGREFRLITVNHADPTRLCNTVRELIKSVGLDAAVVPDAASSLLVMYAGETELNELTTVISSLDVPPREPPH